MAKMGKGGAAGGMKNGAGGPSGVGRKVGKAKGGSLTVTPMMPIGKGGKK